MTAFLLITAAVLLLLAVPIGVSLGAASFLTIVSGGMFNTLIVTQKIMDGVNKFSLLAIPMFTLAGEVMTMGGISDKLIYLANRLVGKFKGGLSMVTTLACMFFGAISGSATATASAIGGIMSKPMEEAGYPREYTAAVIGSSGLLGPAFRHDADVCDCCGRIRHPDVHRRHYSRHRHGSFPHGRGILPRKEERLRPRKV